MVKWVSYLGRVEKHFGKEAFSQMLRTLSNKEILKKTEEADIFTNEAMVRRWKKHFGITPARKSSRANHPQAKQILTDYKAGATYAVLTKKYAISSSSLQDIVGKYARSPYDRVNTVKNKFSKEILAEYLAGASTTELASKHHVTGTTLAKIIGDNMRPKGRPRGKQKMIIVNYKDDTVGIFDTMQHAAKSFDENAVDMAEFEINGGIVGVLKAMANGNIKPEEMLLKLVSNGRELWRIKK